MNNTLIYLKPKRPEEEHLELIIKTSLRSQKMFNSPLIIHYINHNPYANSRIPMNKNIKKNTG